MPPTKMVVRSAVSLLAVLLIVTGGDKYPVIPSVHAADAVQLGLSAPLQATPGSPASPTEPARVAPPFSLTLTLLCTCGAVGLVIGVLVLGLVMRRQPEAGSEKQQP